MGNAFSTTTSTPGDPASAQTYCESSAEADALAATLPATLISSFTAATSDQKLGARMMAALRIDAANRYQGRKYGPAIGVEQVREFPRIAYESGGTPAQLYGGVLGASSSVMIDTVWDWDSDNNVAVVPRDVKLAEILEANSILAGTRDKSMQARADGLASQSVGGMSESYRDVGAGSTASGVPTLSRDADALMKKYRLRSGQLR